MKSLEQLLRPNIRQLKPYSCARNEFHGEATTFLDANENPYNAPYNRYPDPLQTELKNKLSGIKGVKPQQIFLGNGSDEPIDLVIRAFCEPGQDNIVAIDPTYGMYEVAAGVNGVEYRKVPLSADFEMDAEAVLAAADGHTKLIFLCTPNNPTGNSLSRPEVFKVLTRFDGIVIVDEAYNDFSQEPSFTKDLATFSNLLIFQTFSKAWGSAGIRLGMAFASKEIIEVLNKIKYPYNINQLTQEKALHILDSAGTVKTWVGILLAEREKLKQTLEALPCVRKVYPSDANFLLVRVDDADATYRHLVSEGVIVRNRNTVTLCRGCLRITIGTPQENELLVGALKNRAV
ncbi:MAG: histidinol-phosphate transaminase [Parabacteroides sp.]|nr:histidinol-phosphate transaminase [Parabacteroides sp.]